MLNKLKAKYAALRPEEQQRVTIAAIVGGIAVFACLAYFIAPFSAAPKPVAVNVGVPPGKTVLSMDDKLLEKSMTLQNDQKAKELEELKKKVELLQTGGVPGQQQNPLVAGQLPVAQGASAVQPLDQIINQRNAQEAPAPAHPAAVKKARPLPPIPPPAEPGGAMPTSFTPPPPPSAAGSNGPYYQQAPVERRVRSGGIGVATNDIKEPAKTAAKTEEAGKKKDKPAVYLPPSFMEATLLSGLNAPTSDAGRSNPMPVFIRIAAPAILPNEVRANLKGCFVIGEAVGSLNDERAHIRLVSISCLSKKGQAVIDQDINGYVQDADGGIGLTGRVVSKMGSAVARLAAVGLLKGVGDAMAQASTTSTVTALGQLNTLGTTAKDVGMSAAGNAIAHSAKGIVKIYEDLTLGSLPVIEVGNGKKITVLITKGVNLEIKNYKTVPWY